MTESGPKSNRSGRVPRRRVVVRPPLHRPGGTSPWARLPVAARTQIGLDRVTAAVKGRSGYHSGQPADLQLAEFVRSYSGVDVGARPAAVLVALFEEEDEARVVLTVRSSHLRAHGGEVAFPGGRVDAGETNEQAALREAYEEVHLDPTSVDLVGFLTPMPTVSSNTLMTPVVATLERRPTLIAAPDEVERIFDVSLTELVADGAFTEEWWSVPGRPGAADQPGAEFPVWFFRTDDEVIWGATARVLTELLCLVLALPGPLDEPAPPA